VSAGEFTGDIAGRPVAVAICVTGPPGLASWIEGCAGQVAATLPGSPGFLGFRLLKYRHAGRRCVFAAVMLWEDLAWFRAWHASRAFAAAYAAWSGNPGGDLTQQDAAARHAGTVTARADFPFRRAPAPVVFGRVEHVLAARLGAQFGAAGDEDPFRVTLKLPEPAGSLA
jgi:heme-degrading monooxygenase HmoA